MAPIFGAHPHAPEQGREALNRTTRRTDADRTQEKQPIRITSDKLILHKLWLCRTIDNRLPRPSGHRKSPNPAFMRRWAPSSATRRIVLVCSYATRRECNTIFTETEGASTLTMFNVERGVTVCPGLGLEAIRNYFTFLLWTTGRYVSTHQAPHCGKLSSSLPWSRVGRPSHQRPNCLDAPIKT